MKSKLYKHFGSDPIVWVAAWGISKLRKRGGQFAGSINGASTWYDAWYDKVMSEETAVKLAQLGVNLVILPFSVGGSARMENFEREDFARVTKYLHKHKIVSLPYLQYQNILQEDFRFKNAPWNTKLDGNRCQFAYWRRTPCQFSQEFRAYFKGLITEALEKGADGIWIDNTHHRPCRCEECVANFKTWLANNRQELLKELYLENFDLIEMPPSLDRLDPISMALLDFNSQENNKLLDDFKTHMRSLSPDALFASNPGISRGCSNFDRGLDLQPFLSMHDLMYLENQFYPGTNDRQTIGNFHGYIACEAAGCAGIPGAWKRKDFDDTITKTNTGMPENEMEIRRIVFEAAACGGAPGLLWAIRTRPEHMCQSSADLMTMYFEHPVIYSAMKKALDFLYTLPVYGLSANAANIAVLHHRESLGLDQEQAWTATHAMEKLLHANSLPYNVLYSEEFAEKAGLYKLIILPGTTVLSDQDATDIKKYVSDGGKLLVLGNCGLWNEKRLERAEFALADLLQVSRFARKDEFIYSSYGAGESAAWTNPDLSNVRINNIMYSKPILTFPAWYFAQDKILNAIEKLLGNDRQVQLSGKEACVTLRKTEPGTLSAHILAYEPLAPTASLTLKIKTDLLAGKTQAFWHTPENRQQMLEPTTVNQNYTAYQLPGLTDYGVLRF